MDKLYGITNLPTYMARQIVQLANDLPGLPAGRVAIVERVGVFRYLVEELEPPPGRKPRRAECSYRDLAPILVLGDDQ